MKNEKTKMLVLENNNLDNVKGGNFVVEIEGVTVGFGGSIGG